MASVTSHQDGTHGFRAPEKEAMNLEAQRNHLQIHTVLSSTSTAKAKNLNREALKTADSAHSLSRLLIMTKISWNVLCFSICANSGYHNLIFSSPYEARRMPPCALLKSDWG